jgi:hypothetical protein
MLPLLRLMAGPKIGKLVRVFFSQATLPLELRGDLLRLIAGFSQIEGD